MQNLFLKLQTFPRYLACLAVVACMLSFSGESAWGQCIPQVTDGFDYPLGDRGYCSDGKTPTPLLENINSEQNTLYPNNPVANPSRGGNNPGNNKWYNISDVGNFLNATCNGALCTHGLHPGEDWNKGSGSNDAGEIVYAIGNGKVVRVSSTFSSYSSGGYTVVIEHTLPNGTKIYSVYVHLTSLNNTSGTLATNTNQFLLSDNTTQLLNSCVTRGTPIGRLATGMSAIIYPHLHFETRTAIANLNSLYPNDNGNGYYGAVAGTSGRHTSMTQAQVTSAFGLMQTDGYLDPSDFIDNNRPQSRAINDNMGIYGGGSTEGRTVKFYFYYSGTLASDGSDLKANNTSKQVRIGSTASPKYAVVNNVTKHPANNNMNIVSITLPTTGLSNDSNYDIAFSLNGQVYTGTNLVYFSNPVTILNNAGLSAALSGGSSTMSWQWSYSLKSLNRGFMSSFNLGNNLKNGEAAVIIVKAALELSYKGELNGPDGTPFRIRTETTNGYYADVPPCHPFFPFIQTLRNYGYTGAVANFGVENITNIGTVCRYVSEVFKLPSSPLQVGQIVNSRKLTNADIYIDRVQKVSTVRQEQAGKTVEHALASGVDDTNLIFGSSDNYTINPATPVRRPVISKILVNIYDAKSLGDAGEKSTAGLNKFVIIGDKFELSDVPSGVSPSVSSSSQNIIMLSGQSREFGSGASTWGNARLQYYWTFSDGSAVSQNAKNSKITFTAPTVTTTTTIDAYGYVATEYGKAAELFTKITVNPLPAGCNPATINATASNTSTSSTCQNANITLSCTLPTGATVTWTGPNGYTSTTQNPTINNIQTSQAGIYYATVKVGTCEKVVSTEVQVGFCTPPPATPAVQASGLNFTNIGNDNVKCNYTIGTAERVIVLMSQSPINQAPVDGQSYSGNNYYPSAQSLGNAKVVYVGSASFVNVYGLTASNTQPYYVAVYAFNGTGTTTKYLATNPASSQVTIPVPIPSIDFGWDPQTIVTGQNIDFYASGGNLVSGTWTLQGGTPSTVSHPWQAYDIVFNTAGTYTITFTATNEWGGTNTVSKFITVLNANDLKSDLIPQSINLPNVIVMNQSLTTSWNVGNIGINDAPAMTLTRIYLSDNPTYEIGDVQLTEQIISTSISNQNAITITKNIIVPSGYVEGTWYLLYMVDVGNSVDEKNETNNITFREITLLNGKPDLILQNCTATPNPVRSGGLLTINGQVKNIGTYQTFSNATILITGHISVDNILSADDYTSSYIAGSVMNVYPNQVANFSSSLYRVHPTIPNGNYFLILNINSGENAESNSSNNTIAIPIIISNPTQPTSQTQGLNFTNITNNSISANWTTNGNGTQRVGVAGLGEITYFDNDNGHFPNDGIDYNVNSNFTLAQNIATINVQSNYARRVVYEGNGNSVNITNLPSNRAVYFSVFDFNGTGVNTDYLHRNQEQIMVETKTSNLPHNGWEEVLSDSPYLTSIQITPNGSIFLVQRSTTYNILKSNDGGKIWKVYKVPSTRTENLSLSFIDNNVGYAYNSFEIFKTTDAGVSWNRVKDFLNTTENIQKIHFFSASNGILLSYRNSGNSAVFKTTDGGSNWILAQQFQMGLLDMQFINSQIGWVVGQKTYKTIDGGTSWNTNTMPINVSTNSFGYKIFFLNENIGWADSGNKLYKTINGGETWTEISTLVGGTSAVGKIHFTNELVGYIVGSQRFLKTVDGGITWSNQSLLSGVRYHDIWVASSNNIWIAGREKLLFTSTGGEARAINAPTLPTTAYCEGSTISVPYTIAGTFTAGNTFSVQLSDTEGKFTNPFVLGTVSSIANGSISCTLPAGIVGTGYKLRLVGSSPATIGAETNYTLMINARPDARFVGLLPSYCSSSPAVTLLPLISGGTFSGTGVSGTTFNPTTAGVGVYTITYSLTQNGCTFSTSQNVEVTTATVSITSANATGCKGESVLLQVSNPRPNAVYQWRKNGVDIGGAVGTMYFASEAGNQVYSAVSSEGGCTATSNNLTINIIEVPKPTIQTAGTVLASSSATGNQWYFNGVPIAGATGQFFTTNHTTDGFYTVEVTQNGCKNTSDLYPVSAPAPNAPSGLAVVSNSGTQASLTWQDNATNETGFVIERSVNPTSDFASVGTVGANVTTYTDATASALATNGTYYYRVMATGASVNSGYSETKSVSRAQTLTFPTITDKVYGDSPFTLNATASSSLAVSYSITTTPATGVATLSGNTITIVGLGSVSVTASQAGNTNYNPATEVVRTFQVVYPTSTQPRVTVDEVIVYPNPSKSGIYEVRGLQSLDKMQVSYTVLDASGKAVQSGVWVGKGVETLNLSTSVNGTYTLSLQGSKIQTSKKIIKQ